MNWQPKDNLTPEEINGGLKLVIREGLISEAMTTLTGGAFLVAMALLMGANNVQVGILASLPTFVNFFQLAAIWLVRRTRNRRLISVFGSFFGRVPLLLIGALPLLFGTATSITTLIFCLFLYNFCASIAGSSWNAWMKDLVPEQQLGAYFSRRSRLMQVMNVTLSLTLALGLEYVKRYHADHLLTAYATMFFTAGVIGLLGAFILSKVPEPQLHMSTDNIFKILKQPLKNPNFRKLLVFNSAWVFAINIFTPFFTVFLMKGMGLSLPYIISFTIISQLCSIATIGMWGRLADRYSNKSVLAICSPLLILCAFAWCFVGIYSRQYANITLLVIIYMFSGMANAGITLSLTNIGLKLAPKDDAIVYLSVKNIVTSIFSCTAPLVGGILADFFTNRKLTINAEWGGPKLNKVFHLISLHEWNFLFAIGGILALISLELLARVQEKGEVEKDVVVRIMRSSVRNSLKSNFITGSLINLHQSIKKRVRGNTI